MAPPTEVWRRLTPAEQTALLARLGPMPQDALPPVGDPHIDAERLVEDAVGGWIRRRRTRAYIGRGITVYYPAEPRFAPDFFVVFDVEEGQRTSWVVDREGRGLDFVLEIHFAGDRAKDLATNVERHARLGIPEYFVFDVSRERIYGWRQAERPGTYVPILPQGGRWRSESLGAELGLANGELRFFVDAALLPLASEIQAELSRALDDALERAEREARRAEEEARRADALAAENADLRALVAKLRGDPPAN